MTGETVGGNWIRMYLKREWLLVVLWIASDQLNECSLICSKTRCTSVAQVSNPISSNFKSLLLVQTLTDAARITSSGTPIRYKYIKHCYPSNRSTSRVDVTRSLIWHVYLFLFIYDLSLRYSYNTWEVTNCSNNQFTTVSLWLFMCVWNA